MSRVFAVLKAGPWAALAAAALTAAALTAAALTACAVTGVGVGYEGGYEYDSGFYEPYGYEYGGWDGGYRVGPPRGDWHRGGPGGGRRGDGGGVPRGGPGGGGSHPYHSPAPGRSMPSIPGRPRGR